MDKYAYKRHERKPQAAKATALRDAAAEDLLDVFKNLGRGVYNKCNDKGLLCRMGFRGPVVELPCRIIPVNQFTGRFVSVAANFAMKESSVLVMNFDGQKADYIAGI